MPDEDSLATVVRRTPWNKGKLIGAKPPLRPNQVWSIRTRLLIERRTRDLALFNLAIDTKLRGCDVVALRVEDVAPNGYAVDHSSSVYLIDREGKLRAMMPFGRDAKDFLHDVRLLLVK